MKCCNNGILKFLKHATVSQVLFDILLMFFINIFLNVFLCHTIQKHNTAQLR